MGRRRVIGSVVAAVVLATTAGGWLSACTPAPKPVQLATSGDHDCALMSDETVRCWGQGRDGALGDGTTTSRYQAVRVPGLTKVKAVAVGSWHSCALISGGAVRCWGYNAQGQLGNGTTTRSLTPITVPGLSGVTAIAAGYLDTCALVAGGRVRCWGDNTYGAVGSGSTEFKVLAPADVVGITGAKAISIGEGFACALLGNGGVSCWGLNKNDELGNDGYPVTDFAWEDSRVPVTIPNLTGAVQLAVGGTTGCVRFADGSVRCWGANGSAQIDTTLQDQKVPKLIEGVTARSISVGSQTICADTAAGLTCWGGNGYATMGIGSRTFHEPPTLVPGIPKGSVGAAGSQHTCAILPTAKVSCWGRDMIAPLKDGSLTYVLSPAPVPGF